MHPSAKKHLERIRSLLEAPLHLSGPPEATPPTCPHCGHASLVRLRTIKRLWMPFVRTTPHETDLGLRLHHDIPFATAMLLPPRSILSAWEQNTVRDRAKCEF